MKLAFIHYLLIFVVLLIVAGFTYTGNIEKSSESMPEAPAAGETHEVVLTETGYEPKEITITINDVVEFKTVRGFQHWPASNLHPTHNLYSAFDPQQPIHADESWSFQFTQAGSWEFHDHLNSTYTGTIVVQP